MKNYTTRELFTLIRRSADEEGCFKLFESMLKEANADGKIEAFKEAREIFSD